MTNFLFLRSLLIGVPMAAFQPASVDAFTVRTMTSIANYQRETRKIGPTMPTPLYASCSSCADDGMSKIEAAGVQRITKGYDKLCKSCPTRIQPRVDTLTEMIMGLPDNEREELMNDVSRRLLEAQNHQEGEVKVKSSRDVYEFQTSSEVAKPEKQRMGRAKKQPATRSAQPNNEREEEEKASEKLSKKMDKARMKFESNAQNSARASHLLVVTNALLSRDSHIKGTAIVAISSSVENGLYHDEMNRLKRLNRTELKMERLKLAAKKAKHEKKIAKQRLKIYGVSVALAEVQAKTKTVHLLP